MPARIVAGVVAALWSLLVLPPQMIVWSGPAGSPRWIRLMNNHDAYDAVRAALVGWGIHDHYAAFGVAIVPAMLLVWWATRPALRALGWSGRVLSWALLVLGPLTALSYLNHDDAAPLRFLWGGEGLLLLLIAGWAVVVAIVAPRGRGIPGFVRIGLIALGPLAVGATLVGGYWPHATMIGVALSAIVLAVWRPGRERPAPSPAAEEAPADAELSPSA